MGILGTSGFIAINNADEPWNTRLSTSLPPGRYCDVSSGKVKGRICDGVTYVSFESLETRDSMTMFWPVTLCYPTNPSIRPFLHTRPSLFMLANPQLPHTLQEQRQESSLVLKRQLSSARTYT